MPQRTRQKSSGSRSGKQSAADQAKAMRRDKAHSRYWCDFLKLWRQCKDAPCRREHRCLGDDPEACFRRGFDAMPGDYQEWIRGALEAAVERGARGEEIGRAGDARRAAYLEKIAPQPAGLSASEVQPEPADPSPSSQADEEARVVVSEHKSPASPGTDTAEPKLPAADPSPPAAWRWTGPLNPPQATCDEEGRLVMPDPIDVAEYNERLRRGLTLGEIVGRGRI